VWWSKVEQGGVSREVDSVINAGQSRTAIQPVRHSYSNQQYVIFTQVNGFKQLMKLAKTSAHTR